MRDKKIVLGRTITDGRPDRNVLQRQKGARHNALSADVYSCIKNGIFNEIKLGDAQTSTVPGIEQVALHTALRRGLARRRSGRAQAVSDGPVTQYRRGLCAVITKFDARHYDCSPR